MRDYPIVPNVFRVASSHSVNTDCAAAASSGCDIKITSGTNANLSTGQLRQQQQQQKQNGNISGQQQQSLVKSFISSQTPTTATTNTKTTTAVATNVEQTTAKTTLSQSTTTTAATLKTSTSQQLQQQQKQQLTKNEIDFIMQSHKSLQKHQQQQQQQQSQQHKLTTHASIERPQCLRNSQLYLHSPYATLPRNTATSQSTLSLLSANMSVSGIDDDVVIVDFNKQQQHQQQQQQQHNFINSNKNNHNHNQSNSNNTNNSSNNNNIDLENNQSPNMLGVISTISGSIPSTGYNFHTTNNGGLVDVAAGGQHQQQHQHHQHRSTTISRDSDLNVAMNNSSANLSKLNGVQQKQQQEKQKHQRQHQQRQQQQQQQQSTLQQRDLKQTTKLDDFAPYRRPHPCSSFERNTNGYLWIITPVAASISVAIVIAALAGPQWLFTEEKLPNTLYNGTANFNVLDDGAFITRYTKSSLWIICTTLQGVETYSCIKIDYFTEKGYQPDPHDSASAIPYTVTKSCPFFLASGIALLLSFIVFLIPTCSHQNNLYYFSAGIMFIVSGLLMLIGLIAYISILKAEIGSKLRPRSTLQPPMFKVTYGQSFFLFVFGFIATEFVGLLNIFLYISLQEVGYYSRLPCFTISNLQEKIKEGENRYNSHTYKSFKHEIERKPIDRIRNQQNKKHQVTAQELELDSKKLLKNMTQGRSKTVEVTGERVQGAVGVVDAATDASTAGAYGCRKHPNGMSSTMFLNELDRRYYFEKASTSSAPNKCNLHSKNLAKSLNELYTETSTSVLPPPPPSAIRAGRGGNRDLQLQTQTLPRPPQQFSDSPQEYPLTRSVSTTTDIYANQNVVVGGGGSKTDYSNNRRRNVATNTRYNTETQTNCGGSNNKTSNIRPNSNNLNALSKKPQQQQQHDNIYKKKYATTCANNINGGDDGLVDNNLIDCAEDNDDNECDEEEAEEEISQKLCGLKRTIRKTKDELFEEFCKRAGVRPRPKNIYYIANDADEDSDAVAGVGGSGGVAGGGDDNNSTQQSADIEEVMQHRPLRLNNIRTGGNLHHQRRMETSGSQHPRQQQQQQQQQHHGNMGGEYCSTTAMENNRIFGESIDVVDVDEEDVDERGFKKMTENEDHLYVIDDNVHLMPQAIRNGRRASMYVEPNHLRRLNSNLSLHAVYAPSVATRGLQKSLYDLDTANNEFGYATTTQYGPRDIYGGSQQRLHHDYLNQPMYQSRTLPRTFLKRNADSQDSILSANVNASATQLHNIYSTSQQRLTTLMMQQQQQQQLQQQNRYMSMSREQDIYNSSYGLHKSNEELNRHYVPSHQQQQSIYMQTQQPHHMQYQQQQQHSSNTNYTTANMFKQQHPSPLVQWPAAIPSSSSPSNFSGSFRMYGPATNNGAQNSNHTLLARSQNSSGAGTASGSGGGAAAGSSGSGSVISAGGQQVVVNGSANNTQAKFQRGYAFDEQRRTSNVVADAFDLDEIERERRRSHASLFNASLSINTNINTNSGGGVSGGGGPVLGNNKNHDQYDMINGTAV